VILVSEADIFLSESLRILAERLSQSEIGLPLRQICYYSPPEEVGGFSTEIKSLRFQSYLNISKQSYFVFVSLIQVLFLHSFPDIVFEPAMHISSLDQQISHIQNLRFVEHRPFSGLDKTLSSIR